MCSSWAGLQAPVPVRVWHTPLVCCNISASMHAGVELSQRTYIIHDTVGVKGSFESGRGSFVRSVSAACCLLSLMHSFLVAAAAGAAVAALQLENSRLREEVDSLKRRLPALGLLRRTSSNVQLAGAATDQLVAELAQVRGLVCLSVLPANLREPSQLCTPAFCTLTDVHDGCLCTCACGSAVAGRQ